MKALQIKGYGDVESNLAFNNIENPSIKENQVLIEIFAASTNPIDYKIIEGLLKQVIKLNFPTGIGYDLSGIVRETGKSVKGFKVGDEVFSSVPQESRSSFAEFIAVDENMVCLKPKNLNFEEAASLPMVGLTTIQAFKRGNLKAGDRILIHAGSGGIGSFAIQYAKNIGAYVYTTTGTANVGWVKELGADRVIDYKTENYLDLVKDVDFVYDTLGEQFTIDAFKVIKVGGKVISLIGPVDDETAKEFGLNLIARIYLYFKRIKLTGKIKEKSAYYKLISMKPNSEDLEIIKKLVEENKVKSIIDKIFPFSESVNALLYQKSGRAKGKIIIKMK
ncbi:NADP-dependent oxidoreductase [Kaistella sp. G5-32]|uniref:NADP-dependent oxidoreductase n=1 Tax=Kaistella gelatinilytica TaxID=2787636 RepID=A0ABS0FBB3_9FLAO|nr:NADP-dependent oxidoreductase [Kaistella gelatinilytica]MBF8456988.1 NADP-dependent oxidoreductase [Kaistella gelatinilytica]